MCMNKLIYVIQYVTKYVISSHINKGFKFIHGDFKIFQLLFNERYTFLYIEPYHSIYTEDDYPPPNFLAFLFFLCS